LEKKIKNMTLNCNGKIINFNTQKIMGILNISDDSFYDGGKYNSLDKAVSRVSEMINQGVDIIDVGAVSSKPGSKIIKGEDELKLTSEYIIEFSKSFNDVLFSIDTYNSKVAEFALNYGFAIINDISSGKYDSRIIDVVKEYNAGYVIMHMKGDPDNMQKKPTYINVVDSIYNYLDSKIEELESINIKNIIIDPGFGFGKTIDHNFEILSNLEKFKEFKKPLLAGISRKSMIYKFLNIRPDRALNGTSILNTIALNKGADVLRVHDIIEAKECLALFNKLN
jgi:dihydropteroate synthase